MVLASDAIYAWRGAAGDDPPRWRFIRAPVGDFGEYWRLLIFVRADSPDHEDGAQARISQGKEWTDSFPQLAGRLFRFSGYLPFLVILAVFFECDASELLAFRRGFALFSLKTDALANSLGPGLVVLEIVS